MTIGSRRRMHAGQTEHRSSTSIVQSRQKSCVSAMAIWRATSRRAGLTQLSVGLEEGVAEARSDDVAVHALEIVVVPHRKGEVRRRTAMPEVRDGLSTDGIAKRLAIARDVDGR